MEYQSALKNAIMSKIVIVLQVDLHSYQFLKLVLIFEGEQIFINSRNVLSKNPRNKGKCTLMTGPLVDISLLTESFKAPEKYKNLWLGWKVNLIFSILNFISYLYFHCLTFKYIFCFFRLSTPFAWSCGLWLSNGENLEILGWSAILFDQCSTNDVCIAMQVGGYFNPRPLNYKLQPRTFYPRLSTMNFSTPGVEKSGVDMSWNH